MLMNFKFYVKRFLLSLFLVLASTMLYAQKKADITGTVYDSDGTTPAVGCAVTIEGTPTGVITDINGKYKIRGGENQTLVFSSLGYKTQKILIGPKTRIDVTLEADSQEIEGVVVTALGIKRDEKALGYAVTKVDNDVLTSTVSSNWMNALSGKVAGLNFDQASTGPGGSMRVTLRGETSINMNGGTALFVVDVMKESNAVKEAKRLNIPVFAIVDTCCDPTDIDYVIPANDDASNSIAVILTAICAAVAEGTEERRLEKEKEAQEGIVSEEEGAPKKEGKPRIKKAVKAAIDAEEAAVADVVAAVETPFEEPGAVAAEQAE